MSDYWPADADWAVEDFPLFQPKQARSFHERDEAQSLVLASLRAGNELQQKTYESAVRNGSRLAPVIEQLRNAHGFSIDGDGSLKSPYVLKHVSQSPTLARVTPEMKAAYYLTPHWFSVRSQRFAKDSLRCVLCWSPDELQCHHVSYSRLFNEPLVDLLTLCKKCHGRVHEDCRLKFPSGVSVQYAHWLGWKGFEAWLLP